jgi:hypothetical protein
MIIANGDISDVYLGIMKVFSVKVNVVKIPIPPARLEMMFAGCPKGLLLEARVSFKDSTKRLCSGR